MDTKIKDHFIIKKKLKFLIEITLEKDGKFKVHDKLAVIFTQAGLQEFEKLQHYVKNYFSTVNINNIIEFKEELVFLVSILIIFSKKENKTIIFIFNSFSNKFLNYLIKLNLLEFYLKRKNKIFINFLDKYYAKRIFNSKYLNYFKKIYKLNMNKNKKRVIYNYFVKNKFLEIELSWKLKWKKFKLRKKWKMKKKRQLKKINFIFILKNFKWLSYFILLKIIILKTFFFNKEFIFLDNKLFFYSMLMYLIHYKKKLKKKFRRRFILKKKYFRDKYGEIFKNDKIEYKKKK